MTKVHIDQANNSNSFERKYVYDGQEILFELDHNNDILTTFTHSTLRTDDVLAMDKNNSSYFYLKDHLGTVNEIIDGAGNLVQRYVYSSFGKILRLEDGNAQEISTPIVENFYTFTGREFDQESGLNYYRARYYDSTLGRFLSADPHPGVVSSPVSFNSKYIYGNNDPMNRVDPMGTFNFKKAFSFYLSFYNFYASIFYINSNNVFSEKDTTRLSNAAITGTVIAYGAFISPGAAAVSTGGTAFSRRNKGNPLDNRHFAGQFAVSFGVSSVFNYSGFSPYSELSILSVSKDLALDAGITLGREYIAKDLNSDGPSDRPIFTMLLFSYYAFSPLLE